MKCKINSLNTIIGLSLSCMIVFASAFVINRALAQGTLASKKAGLEMGRIVIVGYRPKPGKADALKALLKSHVQRLRAEGLATSRESIIIEAKDGTVLEVFEWKSKEAIESAHTNSIVQTMWKEYSEVCDYVPIASVEEAKQLFSEFTPLNSSDKNR